MTYAGSTFMNHKIDLKPKMIEQPSIVKKVGNNSNVYMSDSIFLIGSLHTGIAVQQRFDEKEIVNNFRKIQDFEVLKENDSTSNPKKQYVEIQKSLDEFCRSMGAVDVLSKFKRLYNSLELIANSYGINRHGDHFDNEVNMLSMVPVRDVAKWRNYYNRFKHTSIYQGNQRLF